MNRYEQMIRRLQDSTAMDWLQYLYGSRNGTLLQQKARYTAALKKHEELFGTGEEIRLVSAPGRTEIGGNHTDHNRGKVLAAAVNLDTLAAVSPRSDMTVHLISEGHGACTVDLNDLSPKAEETGKTAALIRGVAARMAEYGKRIGGFDAYVQSTVAAGSGLSSSAAFEVMISAVLDELYNGFSLDFRDQAKIGQYAENVYFGKPSGLLDQMASAAGGLVAVDFKYDDPEVHRLNYSFDAKGYQLVVVATGGSHEDLTDCYAAIPAEMKQVAEALGGQVLRNVRADEFFQALPDLYGKVPDRALLRAFHFFGENNRVTRQVEALEQDDLMAFLWEIICSGRSSYMYLQNVYPTPVDQSLSLALAMAENLLTNCNGAWRIHGGGFAGTTLNFVPQNETPEFIRTMESVFGDRCCHVLSIRPQGAAVLR